MTDIDAPVRDGLETASLEERISRLISQMTLDEKVGQLQQIDATCDSISDDLRASIGSGRVGSIINQVDPDITNELQRIAVEDSRLGIPLLVGRDVIHGFKTVFPIPLGQAASWNPDLVQAGAEVAAAEASRSGVNWTFAPMIDISRDPRWGRIAESFGEDPYLSGVLGAAMTLGFQGTDLSDSGSIAACAKHFAGYGASESGRDYNTTNIPENELRNIYLPPFKAVLDAGVATFMASFSDIDGIPASANEFLMDQVLRQEWSFDGLVVGDWDSIRELSVHGITASDKESAFQAASAGVDMEMAGDAYANHLANLVDTGQVPLQKIDGMVANVLRVKLRLGLFESAYTRPDQYPAYGCDKALALAKKAAIESIVLLTNRDQTLPLKKNELTSLAVIGPMANVPAEQLGTWVFDGEPASSITPLEALKTAVGDATIVNHVSALPTTFDQNTDGFDDAIEAVKQSDAAVVFLGEEAILSGEAHCRADIDLPGAQVDLVRALKTTGKPVIAVILAGRPLTLDNVVEECDAILFGWHPGTMTGPAISDLLFGEVSPSGRLPVSFPKMVGQIPIYYNHKHTGRPPSPETVSRMDEIEVGAKQTSLGMTAFHFDAGYKPLFPFGYGLSYADFEYSNLKLSTYEIGFDEKISIQVEITNVGAAPATETVQLYVRDLVGSLTRPVKELKGFKRIHLAPSEYKTVEFLLSAEDLSFFRRDKTHGAEPGEFHIWVGPNSEEGLQSSFSLI